MALTDQHAPGATPLTHEQIKGLRNPFITTHEELNRAEQSNIVDARVWARTARSIVVPHMLSRDFVEELHRRMFGEVWSWAGQQRTVDTNIGVDFSKIGVELRILFDDARYWLDHGTYPPIECSVRIHHRLALIHPFPNGNGRLARYYADLLLTRHFKRHALNWGGGQLGNEDPRRALYIEALRAADNHDYAGLIEFAIS
jgi:Fic-DOC domain mobile mystery protein B